MLKMNNNINNNKWKIHQTNACFFYYFWGGYRSMSKYNTQIHTLHSAHAHLHAHLNMELKNEI